MQTHNLDDFQIVSKHNAFNQHYLSMPFFEPFMDPFDASFSEQSCNLEATILKEDTKETKRERDISPQTKKKRQMRRNERERARQNRINKAFDILRKTIPDYLTPCKSGQKLTQIETLRLESIPTNQASFIGK